ncbi:MAG: hypothetical protein ACJ8GN_04495 [Longimicrobiaceae bacterium]
MPRCNVQPSLLSGCYAWRGDGFDGDARVAAVGYFFFSGTSVLGGYTGTHNGNPVVRTIQSGTVSGPDVNGFGHIHFVDNASSSEDLDFVMANGGTELYLVHKRQNTAATYVARKV